MKKGRKVVPTESEAWLEERSEFLSFWFRNPGEKAFERFMVGRALRPYQLWWMAKCPNGAPEMSFTVGVKPPKRARKVGRGKKAR